MTFKKESEAQVKFSRWLREEGLQVFGKGFDAFELKLARRGRVRRKALADHQREALLRAERGYGLGLGEVCGEVCGSCSRLSRVKSEVHKISDMSAGAKPFDCFMVNGGEGIPARGWVVVVDATDGVAYGLKAEEWEAVGCSGGWKGSVKVSDLVPRGAWDVDLGKR